MSTIQEEQDLDAALDSILGDHHSAAAAAKTTNGKQQQHIGAPMPKTLIEQVRQTKIMKQTRCSKNYFLNEPI